VIAETADAESVAAAAIAWDVEERDVRDALRWQHRNAA
jgi:hypothetical protein